MSTDKQARRAKLINFCVVNCVSTKDAVKLLKANGYKLTQKQYESNFQCCGYTILTQAKFDGIQSETHYYGAKSATDARTGFEKLFKTQITEGEVTIISVYPYSESQAAKEERNKYGYISENLIQQR